jgi:hypothetical protein
MSIIAKLTQKKKDKGVFGIVAGLRLGGKSTLAGTLPGQTLLIQAALRETGSSSAAALASSLGNELTIVEFETLSELREVLLEAAESKFDNIYIDGITAITEVRYNEPEVLRKATSGSPWGAFDLIKKTMADFIELSKKIAENYNKNVFMTLALNPEFDSAGSLIEVKPELKGKATLSIIKGYAPTVLVIRSRKDEKGQTIRELITKNDGPYSARIDTLLDQQNPGVLPADLSQVITLIKGV